MKKKHVLLIFLLVLALLLIGAQVRYRGLDKDIAFSQLLFALASFILVKKNGLKGRRKYLHLPFAIFFWYVFSFVFDNIFSNSHDWEFITVGTPNMLLCVVGSIYGALLASAGRLRFAGAAMLIISGVFSFWFATRGKEYWVNYCNEGTFTGKVSGDRIENWQLLVNPTDTLLKDQYRDKFVVLDFWSMSCLNCFKKFPMLDGINKQYSKDKRMALQAVNLPLKDEDSTKYETARQMAAKYTFKNVFADSTAWKAFNIDGVPTVVVLKNDEIVFKGSLELAKDFLAENLN